MPFHAFADETKAKGFVMALTLVPVSDVGLARTALRGLLLPGQRRLHFKDESRGRQQQIVEVLRGLPIALRFYDAGSRHPVAARKRCLRRIAQDLSTMMAERLVIETDIGQVAADVSVLTPATRELRQKSAFAFHHMAPAAEPLLWASDAAAWCYAQNDGWRRSLRDQSTDIVV